MNLNVMTASGAATSLEVSQAIFGRDFNETLVHQVVVSFLSAARQGTKAQKTRAEVRGGGRKPWKQKGSGRARAGTIRSPLWRGGGRIFAAVPRSFESKVNRKMYRAAMQCILSELVRQDRLIVVDEFRIDHPKTKDLSAKLAALNLSNVLILTDSVDTSLYLSSRNLYRVDVVDVEALDPVSLISHDKVIATASALKRLDGALA